MINLTRINPQAMSTEPYQWAFIDGLFEPNDAEALAKTFPKDHFKTFDGYDKEKSWAYEARSLVGMGASAAAYGDYLSPTWKQLASELTSPAYRSAMSQMTGLDLKAVPIEVNVFHYGASTGQGPHVDLKDKLVTHVFYFNGSWTEEHGGCLAVLRSCHWSDVVTRIQPIIGNSFGVVRSEKSWHAVDMVKPNAAGSRRSMTVTFYRPGSVSTMWPPGTRPALHE